MKRFLLALIFLLGISFVPVPAVAENTSIERAKSHVADGEYLRALGTLKLALDKHPEIKDDPAYMLVFGDAAMGRAAEIEVDIRTGFTQLKYFKEAAASYQLAKSKYEAGSLDARRADLRIKQLMLKISSIADALRKKNDKHVVKLAELMMEVRPEDSSGAMTILEVGQRTRDTALQLKATRALVAMKYKQSSVYKYAAMLEMDKKHGKGAKAALAHIDAGLVVLPGDEVLLYERAKFLHYLKQKPEAMKVLGQFLKQVEAKVKDEKKRVPYIVAAAALYERMGELDLAEARYVWVLDQQPENLQSRYQLGTIYINRGVQAQLAANRLELDEEEKRKALDAEAKQHFLKAKPHFEYVHNNARPDLLVMQSLVSIYQQLGEEAKIPPLLKAIKKLRAGQ